MNMQLPLRGPSGMRTEHLKGWLAEVRKKYREETAVGQENTTEGMMMAEPDGMGGEGT